MVEQLHGAPSLQVPRRAVVAGGVALGLGATAGCGGPSQPATAGAPAAQVPSGSPASPAAPPAAATVSVDASSVPVGGGAVVDKRYVVTQPQAGVYKAFSAICTHKGCVVGQVADGAVVCPCHGSHFAIDDGRVLAGPAPAALPTEQLDQQGSTLVVGG